MCIVDSWSDAMSEENGVQNHQILSNLKANVHSRNLMASMTYSMLLSLMIIYILGLFMS